MALGTLKVFLSGDTTKFRKALKKAQWRMKKFARNVKRVAGQAMKAFALLGGVVAFKLVRAFVSFDKAMTNSLAIMTGVTSDMRKQMANVARDMSTKVTFSASQLAEAYFFLASAGLTAQESMKTLGTVAKFAQAGMFDMALATELLVGSVKALGLANGTANETLMQTKRVADILVKANTLANASVEQFAEALGAEAGATMKAFNVDVEEGVAVLASFADKMVKGQKGGMLFSRFLKFLIPSALNNAEAFKKLGIEVFNADKSLRPMADIVQSLERGLFGMTAGQKSAALSSLGFQKKFQGAILPIIGSSDAIRTYTKELKNSAGFSDKVAGKQVKSLSAQVTILWNNFETLTSKVGDASSVMQGLADWLGVVNENFQSTGTEMINTFKFQLIEYQAIWAKIIGFFMIVIDNFRIGFTWIGDNWGKLWRNVLDIAVGFTKDFFNIYKNMWMALLDIQTKAWELLKKAMTGGDIAGAFDELFNSAVSGFAKTIGDVGKETEKAMAGAGVTKLALKGVKEIGELFAQIDKEKFANQKKLLDNAGKALLFTKDKEKDKSPADAGGKASQTAIASKFAGAVEKGTVEAYRAEITANKKGPENETAKNTKESLKVQKEMLKEQKRVKPAGMLSLFQATI